MSYALLFPGQGSQHPDMLPWLDTHAAAQPALQHMAQAIGADWRARLQDPDFLHANAIAQPLVTGTALAAWAVLQPLLKTAPAIVAGYSVGELPAFACAGVFDIAAALGLATLRAAAMDRAGAGAVTGLLSVSGLPADQVAPPLECAIRLGPTHHIFGARRADLEAAEPLLTAAGAQCKWLEVRLASHSSWMTAASTEVAALLQNMPLAVPDCPVATNFSGNATRRVEVLRHDLAQQISHTVEWAACMEAVTERGVRCVLELGAGHALAKLWAQRFPEIPVRSLEDFRSPEAVTAWAQRHATD
ncbi:[acyl-carrier-protein] S-malonyltransferase [Rhodoferax sp. OV413]|uniref:acyltransferase domain-containing protein n=1 Tax=Rhodoferax sp. OV413 TaxID=1855285 RepID=UPI000883B74E|nr:acyltransferase domain-containing protein [Rhodoferax sp. OV413]SDP83299.1 [acyl-carrier-protein] S-malonyltransferase [Rhodoferax sp. OV413]